MLYLGRASVPTPKLGELLVQVHGASVKGGELVARAGGLRLLMLRSPFPRGTGIDFAGEIEAVEGDADGLVVGDRVWGLLPRDQYATGRGGVRHSAVRPRVLQLGKALGAQVTGLASGRNLSLVTELGADNVVDRTTVRPGDPDTFDVVLDTAGSDLKAYRRLLGPGGRRVTITPDPRHLLRSAAYIVASAVHGTRRVRIFFGVPRRELLADLTAYVQSGAIRPVIDTIQPLTDVASAHRAFEARGTRGKHVIRVR